MLEAPAPAACATTQRRGGRGTNAAALAGATALFWALSGVACGDGADLSTQSGNTVVVAPNGAGGAGGEGGGRDSGDDAGTHDGGDAGTHDGGDAGAHDAGTWVVGDDGGRHRGDAGADEDAGDDAGVEDAGVDAGVEDAGVEDAGVEDAGADDAGIVTCSLGCHGSVANAAPPVGTWGETETTESAVGAHQAHLASSSWSRTVQCADCHPVPTKAPQKDPAVPTHLNGKRDLAWGLVAKQGAYDEASATCTGVHCHGGDMMTDGPGGATNRTPVWTQVDGTQAACGTSCHSLPPGGTHPQAKYCPSCHSDVIASFVPGNPPQATWTNPSLHVDGKVELWNGYTCTSCHGNDEAGTPAPPRGTKGKMLTTDPAVGAHAQHLGKAAWHRDVACTDCHPLPFMVPHDDGVVDFSWGGPSAAGGAKPAFDAKAVTCAGVYCHGATLSGGALTQPKWTVVDGTQAACGTCHGLPPGGKHPKSTKCATCHGAVVESCPDDPKGCVFQPDVSPTQSYRLHIDGKVEVVVSGACDGCHGAPPANGTHLVHAGGADLPAAYGSLEPRTNAVSYAFNCGYCHPLDPAKHADGVVEVELYDAAAPAVPADPNAAGDRRSVKRENPAAAYVPGETTYPGDVASYTDGSCTNVYCHSAEVPLAASVPFPKQGATSASFAWQSVTPFYDVTQDRCCVGTPDDYPDFTLTVQRAYATPKWVGETYSGPSKCSHCHDYPPRSAPPSNVGAGQGHAWIDPNGYEDGHFWNMGQGWPIQCRRCHASTVGADLPKAAWHYGAGAGEIVFDAAMAITGFATHVNGRKDVAFAYSPAGCDSGHPDLPYSPGDGYPVPCLQKATFDPATRSCANVECHLAQTKVTWGAPYRPDDSATECDSCHQF
jgi:predicted CxxxxCH...CXXCH cytochrome family protein